MKIEDMMEVANTVNHFGGFGAYQSHSVFYVLENFFRTHNVERVIELGTAEGGTAIFFGMQMWRKGKQSTTWDVNKRIGPEWESLARFLGLKFVESDIFSESSKEEIKKFIQQPGITLLFCDNGNKPLEVKTFAPFLKSGDILMAHDWGFEISEKDFSEEMKNFDYCCQEDFDALKTRILCMVKK